MHAIANVSVNGGSTYTVEMDPARKKNQPRHRLLTRARYARNFVGSTDIACLNGCSNGFDLCTRHTKRKHICCNKTPSECAQSVVVARKSTGTAPETPRCLDGQKQRPQTRNGVWLLPTRYYYYYVVLFLVKFRTGLKLQGCTTAVKEA